ncbi:MULTISPECIES: hypothetical protein [Moorena]|uniref:Transposase IS4-like domain-containing protein n=1 Tax=Moorena producens 3L TaxID=489825 RepID=F4XMG8_9CYAN|nr:MULTISPECIES: hypothetical protein [Moorena]EGJ33877.1 hypothetical protein LYNGBM3L_19870 [Moorena producens 3L]NEP65269.1 hypothetical protein [Moorena sp. SIO3A5]NEQ04629.1 hypothetical protein [Moorena sp. SIO4E2]NER89042.1 hypothetical protein [Moorena sp. SIO3A2]
MRVTLEVPQHHPKPHNLQPVEINVLLVEETEKPADGSPPIRWLLLTTLPIDNFTQAWQWVQWYSYRLLIEPFHKTAQKWLTRAKNFNFKPESVYSKHWLLIILLLGD